MAAKTTYFWVVQDKDGFFQGEDREFCSPYPSSRNVWFPTVARYDELEDADQLAKRFGGYEAGYKIRKLKISYELV